MLITCKSAFFQTNLNQLRELKVSWRMGCFWTKHPKF